MSADYLNSDIRVGDTVQVLEVPVLELGPDQMRESRPVFESAVGKEFEVVEVDRFGHIGINVSIESGPSAGFHAIWIEPKHLRKLA